MASSLLTLFRQLGSVQREKLVALDALISDQKSIISDLIISYKSDNNIVSKVDGAAVTDAPVHEEDGSCDQGQRKRQCMASVPEEEDTPPEAPEPAAVPLPAPEPAGKRNTRKPPAARKPPPAAKRATRATRGKKAEAEAEEPPAVSDGAPEPERELAQVPAVQAQAEPPSQAGSGAHEAGPEEDLDPVQVQEQEKDDGEEDLVPESVQGDQQEGGAAPEDEESEQEPPPPPEPEEKTKRGGRRAQQKPAVTKQPARASARATRSKEAKVPAPLPPAPRNTRKRGGAATAVTQSETTTATTAADVNAASPAPSPLPAPVPAPSGKPPAEAELNAVASPIPAKDLSSESQAKKQAALQPLPPQLPSPVDSEGMQVDQAPDPVTSQPSLSPSPQMAASTLASPGSYSPATKLNSSARAAKMQASAGGRSQLTSPARAAKMQASAGGRSQLTSPARAAKMQASAGGRSSQRTPGADTQLHPMSLQAVTPGCPTMPAASPLEDPSSQAAVLAAPPPISTGTSPAPALGTERKSIGLVDLITPAQSPLAPSPFAAATPAAAEYTPAPGSSALSPTASAGVALTPSSVPATRGVSQSPPEDVAMIGFGSPVAPADSRPDEEATHSGAKSQADSGAAPSLRACSAKGSPESMQGATQEGILSQRKGRGHTK
eukprot:gene6042-2653_t